MPLTAVLCREPKPVGTVQVQEKTVVESKRCFAKLGFQISNPVAFPALQVTPWPAAIVTPAIVVCELLWCPALGIAVGV